MQQDFMRRTSGGTRTTSKPRIVGFLCENGAHVLYNVTNPARRKLPANFIGLPVACSRQVQKAEVLKAFLSGAQGVLILGCEDCQRGRPAQPARLGDRAVLGQEQQQTNAQFAELVRSITEVGIDEHRLRLEWISAAEEEKFLRIVGEMIETVRHLGPSPLPSGLVTDIPYCG